MTTKWVKIVVVKRSPASMPGRGDIDNSAHPTAGDPPILLLYHKPGVITERSEPALNGLHHPRPKLNRFEPRHS
ncbi:hypothetical protein IEQ34_004857 [Dendrobium chrysotoxum]|uniref:Uncharacterized protein n=1 Tax=Dendrobium chrysotoxum TaxID=161865 RepID=A0AAV7H9E6_DENCH|nr:hypothetical protein IEQ34_004857 [Dendrobium chrysotoxum]